MKLLSQHRSGDNNYVSIGIRPLFVRQNPDGKVPLLSRKFVSS